MVEKKSVTSEGSTRIRNLVRQWQVRPINLYNIRVPRLLDRDSIEDLRLEPTPCMF